MRSFDPIRLGGHEAHAWVAYHQRRWWTLLRALTDALAALHAHLYHVPLDLVARRPPPRRRVGYLRCLGGRRRRRHQPGHRRGAGRTDQGIRAVIAARTLRDQHRDGAGVTDSGHSPGARPALGTGPLTRPNAGIDTLTAVTPDPDASGAIFNQPITVGSTIPASGTLIGHQLFPGTEHTASLTITASFAEGHDPTTVPVTFDLGSSCTQLYTVTQDCHGITLTFKAPLPATNVSGEAATVTIHPSTGSDVTFALPLPVDPDKVVSFPGSPGLTVKVCIAFDNEDSFDTTHAWTHDPCPTLPTTGTSVTGVVGIGAGLLVAGIGLVVLALVAFRRRRTVAGQ